METIEDNEVRFKKVGQGKSANIIFQKERWYLLRPKVRIEISKSLKIEANWAYFS